MRHPSASQCSLVFGTWLGALNTTPATVRYSRDPPRRSSRPGSSVVVATVLGFVGQIGSELVMIVLAAIFAAAAFWSRIRTPTDIL